MAVKGIKPNILSTDFDASRSFSNDVIGLGGGHGLDWGLRRFFVRDPNGAVINVTQHAD